MPQTKRDERKTERNNSEMIGQLSQAERKMLHDMIKFECKNERTPSVNEIFEMSNCKIPQSRIGECLRRLCDKEFLIKDSKGSYHVSYRKIASRSFVFMFDANGYKDGEELPVKEYMAQYGMKKVTFHARNMWEASRFASAFGEFDYIERRL